MSSDGSTNPNNIQIPIVDFPKCPNCKSGRVKRIGVGHHALSIGFSGLPTSSNEKYTMSCGKCGYKW